MIIVYPDKLKGRQKTLRKVFQICHFRKAVIISYYQTSCFFCRGPKLVNRQFNRSIVFMLQRLEFSGRSEVSFEQVVFSVGSMSSDSVSLWAQIHRQKHVRRQMQSKPSSINSDLKVEKDPEQHPK